MEKLNSRYASNLDKSSELIQRFAQMIQDSGGLPDEVLDLIRKHRSKNSVSKIGVALSDVMVKRVYEEPRVVQISQKPIRDLLKRFTYSEKEDKESMDFSEQLISFFTQEDYELEEGRYQIFQAKIDLPYANLGKFAVARNMALPTYREFFSFSEVPLQTFDFYVESLTHIPIHHEGGRFIPPLVMNWYDDPHDGDVRSLTYQENVTSLKAGQHFVLRTDF